MKKYAFKPDWLHLVPPGEHMLEDMKALRISPYDLAKHTGYSLVHIHKLLKGDAPITVEVAMKLEKILSHKAYLWLNLEKSYHDALNENKK